jgi:alpha-tubulin suppressor-like RCC1 family protein
MDAIVAWGRNREGQLDGTQTDIKSTRPGLVTNLPEEMEVIGFARVAAGFGHSLALINGSVWAWGDNAYGQLGNHSKKSSSRRVRVHGLVHVVEIAAGAQHSLARKEDGTLWAWGHNFNGQLGTGDRNDRLAPVKIELENVTAIAAGSAHSLAITTGTETIVWAWGNNRHGQLGPRPSPTEYNPIPVWVVDTKGQPLDCVRVAGGYDHSLAAQSNGVVLAWGGNRWGQLGDGTTNDRAFPGAVQGLPGGQDAITRIAAGSFFSLALNKGRDEDAGVWAWGGNGHGELGNGTRTINQAYPVPDRVVGPEGKGYLANITEISASAMHALALRESDGTVWAWGDNREGGLGDGTTTRRERPVQVVIAFGPTTQAAMKQVAAGNSHSLAFGQIVL